MHACTHTYMHPLTHPLVCAAVQSTPNTVTPKDAAFLKLMHEILTTHPSSNMYVRKETVMVFFLAHCLSFGLFFLLFTPLHNRHT